MTGKAADISPKQQQHYAEELLPPSDRNLPLVSPPETREELRARITAAMAAASAILVDSAAEGDDQIVHPEEPVDAATSGAEHGAAAQLERTQLETEEDANGVDDCGQPVAYPCACSYGACAAHRSDHVFGARFQHTRDVGLQGERRRTRRAAETRRLIPEREPKRGGLLEHR